MYQNDPMKVLTGEVRLSYANLTTPRAAQQGGEPKYSVTLLIPKTDVKTKADIDAAINAAANEALTKVWNDGEPLSGQSSAASDFAGIGASPAAAPAYGTPTPVAYGTAPAAAPQPPMNTAPWNSGNGINPITGQPM